MIWEHTFLASPRVEETFFAGASFFPANFFFSTGFLSAFLATGAAFLAAAGVTFLVAAGAAFFATAAGFLVDAAGFLAVAGAAFLVVVVAPRLREVLAGALALVVVAVLAGVFFTAALAAGFAGVLALIVGLFCHTCKHIIVSNVESDSPLSMLQLRHELWEGA